MTHMSMDDFTAVKDDDRIEIDSEALSGRTYEVMDVSEEDIGLTKVVAVSLLRDDERLFAIEAATHSDVANLVAINDDEEHEINISDIEFVS